MKLPKFYNLHSHSHYSVLDAVAKVKDIVSLAKERKLKGVCLTEHGTLSSTYELWNECNKEEITPVLGVEAYYVDKYGKDEALIPHAYSHITMLCLNETGWKNLKTMMAQAWEVGFYSKPRVDFDLIKKYNEGIVFGTACVGGLIGMPLITDKAYPELTSESKREISDKRVKKFKKLLGDRFHVEIMMNELEDQAMVNKASIELAQKYDVKIIITHDSHYIKPEDVILHDVVKCAGFKKQLSEPDNGTYETRVLHHVTSKELLALKRQYHPYVSDDMFVNALRASANIVNSVERYPIRVAASALPKFADNAKEMLDDLCHKGIDKLFKKDNIPFDETYQERLQYELGVINKLGMADYFLIAYDIAQEARRRKIPFNTRGSVAGCLVAYLIGISWIDPIVFDTTFERFLTEDRLSLPDIDMDFGKERRHELIEYMQDKYGHEKVAKIVNFTEWKPKGALKDVSRVYGVEFSKINAITSKIPDGVKLWDEMPRTEILEQFLQKNEEIADNSERLIGMIRHRGIHASGVVLTPGDTTDWCPVAWSLEKERDKRERVTEYDMYALEDMNILKLDFLGQNTLDIIQHAIGLIDGDMKSFDDLYAVVLKDLNNKEVYKFIRDGKLTGLFQLGTSSGMRELVKDMECRKITDIMACVALYRTAVLAIGAHTKYVRRKKGLDPIEYLHPKMEEVLKDSYGLLVYQEETSNLAVVLAGFTKSEADNFRKGIKQKDKEKFAKWKNKFITGCKSVSDIDEDLAEEIWGEIEQWSGYGFNLGHSASYGVVAYITAWLKCKYPVEFMTSLLSYNTSEDDKLDEYLKECRRIGIKLITPGINNSKDVFYHEGSKVFYPFAVIKNVGDKAIADILLKREERKYNSMEDFLSRIDRRVANIKVIERLIFSGAFKEFGTMEEMYDILVNKRKDKRLLYCESCDKLYPLVEDKKNEQAVECPNCFSQKTEARVATEDSKFNKTYLKTQVFGFTVDSPMKPYLGRMIECGIDKLAAIEKAMNDEFVYVGGLISKVKKHIDKNGNEMAFITMSDGETNLELLVFASVWEVLGEKLKVGKAFAIRGKVSAGKLLLTSAKMAERMRPST